MSYKLFDRLLVWLTCTIIGSTAHAFGQDSLSFKLSFDLEGTPRFLVTLETAVSPNEMVKVSMPAWSPGYYQLLNYGRYIDGLQAVDGEGKALPVARVDTSSWNIRTYNSTQIVISYSVHMTDRFVAQNALDDRHAYVVPTATFIYADAWLDRPAKVTLKGTLPWKDVATGLTPVKAEEHTFFSSNMDELYDCPILAGQLTRLPSFQVGGIPHDFYAFDVPEGEYGAFVDALRSVVQAASDLIGDIPYSSYTFLGIGDGPGGIEHSNSTTVGFTDPLLAGNAGKRQFSFLAHEYFHHYNAKRIRPTELGPFDYGRANRTKQLWISEGLTVYYEHFILYAAGLLSRDDVLARWAAEISTYESKPGRNFQTLAESSEHTWEDGPFGDQSGKTISYYVKGPVVGLMLDIAIRKASGGSKSLLDVMRKLYYTYYKELGRGFSETEFWAICEEMAGTDLSSIQDYVYTTKAIDYGRYFGYIGLKLVKVDGGNTFVLKPLAQVGQKQKALLDGFFEF